ncbi:hypothetical protein P7K49_023579 [Saguinus oedipus]|uniref:Uncharacterized protein n=1 Tax=Saguinus oedipus TaxID=9490 RepID=A0ABQ9UM50_SAGOE|nr:hypothetical protein P7K49_023579 [Saguinus oedipus]
MPQPASHIVSAHFLHLTLGQAFEAIMHNIEAQACLGPECHRLGPGCPAGHAHAQLLPPEEATAGDEHLQGGQARGLHQVSGDSRQPQAGSYRAYSSLVLAGLGCVLPLLLTLVAYGALGLAVLHSTGMTMAKKLHVAALMASGVALYASS